MTNTPEPFSTATTWMIDVSVEPSAFAEQLEEHDDWSYSETDFISGNPQREIGFEASTSAQAAAILAHIRRCAIKHRVSNVEINISMQMEGDET